MAKQKTTKQAPQKETKKNLLNDKRIIGILAVILIVVLYFIISPFNRKPAANKEYMFKKQGELTFYSNDGKPITKIDIQIAATEFDRELGLMFRKSMNENQGMLFIFPVSQIQDFWMRNTEIPLDMIFVDSLKQIVTIHKNTKTMSDQTYSSTQPALYVIEVNGGFTDKYHIQNGDKVNWVDYKMN